MKTRLYSFCLPLMFLLLSCQPKDNQPVSSPLVGKWKLTKVEYTSMLAGKPNKVVAPPYEEIFELKADSTFRRYRSTGYEATGTYSARQYSAEERGILATFNDKSLSYHELPGHRQNSFTQGQVFLQQVEPGLLMESYVAADGPSFYYQKTTDKE